MRKFLYVQYVHTFSHWCAFRLTTPMIDFNVGACVMTMISVCAFVSASICSCSFVCTHSSILSQIKRGNVCIRKHKHTVDCWLCATRNIGTGEQHCIARISALNKPNKIKRYHGKKQISLDFLHPLVRSLHPLTL